MRQLVYALELDTIAPGPGYVRVPLAAPQGAHTGGPWVHPERPDDYWKPLDCLPYPNAPRRWPTREAVILNAAAHIPTFPRNWRVELHPQRHWLVRRRALTVGFTEAHVAHLERGLRAFNGAGFALNDTTIEAAIDRSSGEPFWLDLSCASDERASPLHADDTSAWLRWLSAQGFPTLAAMRHMAMHLITVERLAGDTACARLLRQYPHRYGSHAASWRLPSFDVQVLDGITGEPFTSWIFARQPLPDAVVAALDLTWAWSPIHVKEMPTYV